MPELEDLGNLKDEGSSFSSLEFNVIHPRKKIKLELKACKDETSG